VSDEPSPAQAPLGRFALERTSALCVIRPFCVVGPLWVVGPCSVIRPLCVIGPQAGHRAP